MSSYEKADLVDASHLSKFHITINNRTVGQKTSLCGVVVTSCALSVIMETATAKTCNGGLLSPTN